MLTQQFTEDTQYLELQIYVNIIK